MGPSPWGNPALLIARAMRSIANYWSILQLQIQQGSLRLLPRVQICCDPLWCWACWQSTPHTLRSWLLYQRGGVRFNLRPRSQRWLLERTWVCFFQRFVYRCWSSSNSTWTSRGCCWSCSRSWCWCSMPPRDILDWWNRVHDWWAGISWLWCLRRLPSSHNRWILPSLLIIRFRPSSLVLRSELLRSRQCCRVHSISMYLWILNYALTVLNVPSSRLFRTRLLEGGWGLLAAYKPSTSFIWWPSWIDACI